MNKRQGKYIRYVGRKATKEYSAFLGMRKRALQTAPSMQEKCEGTIYEGGMELQEEWKSAKGFEDFVDHINFAPGLEYVVDRIDNNKGYIKNNIRWADYSQSNKNTRNARMITAFGKTQNLCDWAKETGFNKDVISSRIDRGGWTPEQALTKEKR